MERRRREWDGHVTRMDSEKLVKISRENIPSGRRSPGGPKRSLVRPKFFETGGIDYNEKNESYK